MNPEKKLIAEIQDFVEAAKSPQEDGVIETASRLYNQATGKADSCKLCNYYTYLNYFNKLLTTPSYAMKNSRMVRYKVAQHLVAQDAATVKFEGQTYLLKDVDDAFAQRTIKRGQRWFVPVSVEERIENEAKEDVVEEAIEAPELAEIDPNTVGAIVVSEPVAEKKAEKKAK